MKLSILTALVLPALCFGIDIAIIDSGLDTEHKDLIQKLWINPLDSTTNNRDEDKNGYPDDVYGWNFGEQNNLVMDRQFLGTFDARVHEYFAVQRRQMLEQLTDEDRQWLESARNDPEYMSQLQLFGNFVHGTHVAGIAQVGVENPQLMTLKLIPTKVSPAAGALRGKGKVSDKKFKKYPKGRIKLVKAVLGQLAGASTSLLQEIVYYLKDKNVPVANGSFGTGVGQAKMISTLLWKVVTLRATSPHDKPYIDELAKHFLTELSNKTKDVVALAPNTLFVFAAGNDGESNDKFPASPASARADNVISVAATYGASCLAPFSNYGKLVDVAAPGMFILSQIPGDEYLEVSGTSQAAPYVTSIAASILEINSALKPAEVKKIILATVDKKDYLTDKVLSDGLVNLDRATTAAKLSLLNNVEEAASQAQTMIPDQIVSESITQECEESARRRQERKERESEGKKESLLDSTYLPMTQQFVVE